MPPDQSTIPAHWGLLDAEAQHRAFPDAFPIPSRTERESLRPGDMVKLVFVLDPPPGSGPNAERMWVEVRTVEAGSFEGRLTNDPSVIHDLALGTFLAFGPEHVAGIALQSDEVAFDVSSRAVVSKRALARNGPPGWAGHDEPVDSVDSGWTVSAGDEPGDYFSGDPLDSTQIISLGELVQRYPALVEVFQAGAGEWVYRPDHRRYVRLKEQPAADGPPADQSRSPQHPDPRREAPEPT